MNSLAIFVAAAILAAAVNTCSAQNIDHSVKVLADVMIRSLTYQLYVDKPEDDFVHGHTWPLHAISMGGIEALWNVYELYNKVRSEAIKGDFVETGVWKGANGILVKKLADAYGDKDITVYCLDSYQWLPPPNHKFKHDHGDMHHTFARDNPVLAVDLEAVKKIYLRYGINTDAADSKVKLVKGWFNDTAPVVAAQLDAISILRLDGDMYGSTWEVLVAMYQKVSVGGFIIVDDYMLPGAKAATDDFRKCIGSTEPLLDITDGTHFGFPKGGKCYWKKEKQVVLSDFDCIKALNA